MAERSTLTIPGVNSSFQTDKMIEDLMKIERIPLEKKQNKIESFQSEKKSWLKINNKLSLLENSCKKLYGHENPFNQKIGTSSSDEALAVWANRDAEVQTFDLKINQIAKSDKLKTPSLPTGYQVPKGKYTFSVGKKTIGFYYKGGSLSDFSAMLNKKGKDFLNSTVVKTNSKSQILIIESLKTGRSNQLQFLDDAKKLALETGMISDKVQADTAHLLAKNLVVETAEKESVDYLQPSSSKGKLIITYHFDSEEFSAAGKTQIAQKTKEAQGEQKNGVRADEAEHTGEINQPLSSENSTLSQADETDQNGQGRNPHFNKAGEAIIPISGSVTVEEVTVFQAPSLVAGLSEKGKSGQESLEAESAAEKEKKISGEEEKPFSKLSAFQRDQQLLGKTNEIILLNRVSGTESIDNLIIDEKPHNLSFAVEDYLDLQTITFQNPFETKKLIIDSVVIDDGNSRSYTPLNPLQLAQDSIVEMNGLSVTRPSNKIDDLVQGVTLNLKKPSDEAVSVNIKYDKDSIKNSILEWVFNYNKTLETITILTSSDEKVIEELSYLDDEEKAELQKELGTMKGNNTLNGIKNRLQTLSNDPYKADSHSSISVLNDMGIGTNVVDSGRFNLAKLRGYLEIDEKKLDSKIEENPQEIKNFFAIDTNEDLVADNGLAFQVGNFLKAYTSTGGVISTKTSGIDTQVKRLEKEVETLESKMIGKEREYKIKYGRMEGMINEIQKKSSSIDKLNRNNN